MITGKNASSKNLLSREDVNEAVGVGPFGGLLPDSIEDYPPSQNQAIVVCVEIGERTASLL